LLAVLLGMDIVKTAFSVIDITGQNIG